MAVSDSQARDLLPDLRRIFDVSYRRIGSCERNGDFTHTDSFTAKRLARIQLADLAHELRRPLRAIAGFTGLLRDRRYETIDALRLRITAHSMARVRERAYERAAAKTIRPDQQVHGDQRLMASDS